eukprot:6993489-Prorocentrum_lima.AAC.1
MYHDIDVLRARLEIFSGEQEGDDKDQGVRVPHSEPYPRKRDKIVRVARGIVPTTTYLAFTLPEMEIKASQVHTTI